MTRREAAAAIANAEVFENDYETRIWNKGGHSRVYFSTLRYKQRRRLTEDIGYVSIEADGTVDCSNLSRQKGTIDGRIADLGLTIDAETPVVASRGGSYREDDFDPANAPDDPMERLEWEARRDESRPGRTGE